MGSPDSSSAAPASQLREAAGSLGSPPLGLQTSHPSTSISEWGPPHCPGRVPWLAPRGPPVHTQQTEAKRCGSYCPHLHGAQQTHCQLGRNPAHVLPATGHPSLRRPLGFQAQRVHPCPSVTCSKPGGARGACSGPHTYTPRPPDTETHRHIRADVDRNRPRTHTNMAAGTNSASQASPHTDTRTEADGHAGPTLRCNEGGRCTLSSAGLASGPQAPGRQGTSGPRKVCLTPCSL